MDCAGGGTTENHRCGVEIHPVYSMALDVDTTRRANRWVFFARNFGNEGYCAPDNNVDKPRLVSLGPLGTNTHQLVLRGPDPGGPEESDFRNGLATATLGPVEYWSKDHYETVDASRCRAQFVKGTGVVLTFSLPDPTPLTSGDYVIDGEVIIDGRHRREP
jgi:hypothetical protein